MLDEVLTRQTEQSDPDEQIISDNAAEAADEAALEEEIEAIPSEQTEEATSEQIGEIPSEKTEKSTSEEKSPRWYVVHTYSGYENKVKEDLEKTVQNRGLQDLIFDIKFPTEQVLEYKEGTKKPKSVQRKLFPGYVMIKMFMNPNTWYIVRNTRGVTGFVGPASGDPIPLSDEEVAKMGIEHVRLKVAFEIGDTVHIVSGPFANFDGVVQDIDAERQVLTINIFMFGKETPMELDFIDVVRV